MSFVGLELQKAIYDRLKGSIYTKLYRIYDTPPQDPELPYIEIGEGTTTDWGTKTERGYEVVTEVHVWSDYKGFKEAKEIIKNVDRAVMTKRIEVDGFRVAVQLVDRYDVKDESGIKHGILAFRFKLLEGNA